MTDERLGECKVIIGQLEAGEFCIASTSSPYFCFTGETEQAVVGKAQRALEFYQAPRADNVRQHLGQSFNISSLAPSRFTSIHEIREEEAIRA